MPIKVVTFGCRLNTYESEVIKKFLENKFKNKEIIIFNTCTVTDESEKQLKQSIRKHKRENPNAIIIAVGCAIDANRETYENMSEINFILGNKEKMNILNYKILGEIDDKQDSFISDFTDRTRAFVKIQDGCDNHCTFCATRLARGKSISVDPSHIIQQINKLNKYNEITLTGVNITDYGKGLDIGLGQLIKEIIKETNLKRIRLSSLDIYGINDDLKEILFNENRVMPHVHLSLQSGDDTILKKMNRRHNRHDVIKFLDEYKKYRKNAGIGADFIAGFPTETNEMHKNTFRLIEEAGIVYGHIFPYSIRKNTPAALMPQTAVNIRRERAKELRDLCRQQFEKFTTEQLKLPQKILVENEKQGRTENYLLVKLDKNKKYEVGSVLEL
ncbi:MAG: tRNA (N(6)-L-threonylcarbamoyladenosine(37)-C(2))-methylthiotransferase MtaB [Rickettsiales bacterium]|jgi:threonylcarbamoyladenosine tRNA methylthiotransferase MtaB|nr:tRNA (N(6)-L-threonylcarbamoyladenosine(37)-C(2))-methylthiotransferase MtaB [Rickettsiales bacterium]